MSEKSDGSNDGLFTLESLRTRAPFKAHSPSQNRAEGQNSPETPRSDAKFTPDALSDIRCHVDRNSSVAWWPEWPDWASTEQRDDWDSQELADREVPCSLCGAERNEACHGVVDGAPLHRTAIRFRVAHVARHKARAELAARTDDDSDEHALVDLTDEGRAYLASLRTRVAASERMQRIGEDMSPLVVDDAEVRS